MVLETVVKVLEWLAIIDRMPPQERLPTKESSKARDDFWEATRDLRYSGGPFSARMSRLLRRRK